MRNSYVTRLTVHAQPAHYTSIDPFSNAVATERTDLFQPPEGNQMRLL